MARQLLLLLLLLAMTEPEEESDMEGLHLLGPLLSSLPCLIAPESSALFHYRHQSKQAPFETLIYHPWENNFPKDEAGQGKEHGPEGSGAGLSLVSWWQTPYLPLSHS